MRGLWGTGMLKHGDSEIPRYGDMGRGDAYKGRFFGPNPSDSPSLVEKGRVGTQVIPKFPLPAPGRGLG